MPSRTAKWRPHKPKEETKAWQRKQASIQKKKDRQEALAKRTEAVRVSQKAAVQALAEEAFGEGGLTPAREQALAQVLLGPEGGKLSLNNPQALKRHINKAREKFLQLADRYVDTHFKAVNGALASGEFETAARHAEWAMENLGDGPDRLVEPAPRTVNQPAPTPILVGVNLGGLTKEK